MKALASFDPKESLKNQVIEEFPSIEFTFKQNMGEAKHLLPEADILVTYGEDLDESLIRSAHNLKWIMVVSAGMEKMPFEAIDEQGILVTNAKGIHAIPMAEYTIGMMLQTARRAKELYELEKKSEWNRKIKMVELAGKTVSILGAGAIGTEIARLCKAFRMKTKGMNTSGRDVENVDEVFSVEQLSEVVKEADFIVSVLPSTEKTKRLLEEKHFKVMKEEAVFINIGRGDVVDENLLIKMLQEKQLSHAVLDVFEQEPLPKHHSFWNMEEVTVTPHLSGISKMYLPRSFEIFEHNLKVFVSGEGEYVNKIDVKRGY
ncbi:D-2-hydroxyacid dehydrogenase [Bacillus tianshenii]|nr:D-2-hydroxyacid dehydrogenase [Bacillus tianshenii]